MFQIPASSRVAGVWERWVKGGRPWKKERSELDGIPILLADQNVLPSLKMH